MTAEYLLEKISELKGKFVSFFQHRKKVSAMENFTSNTTFPHQSYLMLIKRCLGEGFLGEKEADFLDYLLSKYEVDYLQWAHRTKWIKKQIAKRLDEVPVHAQTFFDFSRVQQTPVNIPIELLMKQGNSKQARL